MADIKKKDRCRKSSLRSLGSGRRMLIMTMKKCVHVHLMGGSRGRVEGLALPPPLRWPAAIKYNWYSSPPPPKKKKNLVVYWCWSKTRDEVGEFMFNALKMVVCLNSAVSFDMYFQQFTLCYYLVKSLQKPSSWYSLLKFVYVTSHSSLMHPLLRKILDPPCICCLLIHAWLGTLLWTI